MSITLQIFYFKGRIEKVFLTSSIATMIKPYVFNTGRNRWRLIPLGSGTGILGVLIMLSFYYINKLFFFR